MEKVLVLLFLCFSGVLCKQYDVIVVGAGGSGSVVAAQLSANPRTKVLLLERGDDNSDLFNNVVFFWDAPIVGAGARINQLTSSNFYVNKLYSQEFNLNMRSLPTFTPITAGGGTSINGNAFGRYTADDMASWGMPGLTYEETINDWKAMERCVGDACNPAYHGTSGPIATRTIQPNSVLQQIMNVMPGIFGVPLNPDTNGPNATGIGLLPRNIDVIEGTTTLPSTETVLQQLHIDPKRLKEALPRSYSKFHKYQNHSNLVTGIPIRQDSWSRFVKPVLSRPNLTVKLGAKVLKLELKSNGKHDVVYEYQNNIYRDKAGKTVVLSAGVYSTPQLLMLSGIGPRAHLENLGIDVVVDNPHVGQNLQDSILTSAIYATPVAPATPSPGSIVVGYYRSPTFTDEGTDMEVAIAAISGPPAPPTFVQLYLVQLTQLRHNAVGSLTLQTKNPNMPPLFSFNMYSTDEEVQPLVDQFKKIRLTMASSGIPFTEVSPGYTAVPLNATDAQITQYLKSVVNVEWHTVGTCSLGKVVDHRFRLIDGNGKVIPGVRIIDLSTVPKRGRSHGTSSGSMFLGMVGSRFIKEDLGL